MITNEQLAELASLARAATPGPWKTGKRRQVVGPYDVCVDTDIGPKVLLSGNSNFIADGERDAAFAAAANPATVLALLDRIAELEQDAARYRWLLKKAWFQQAFERYDFDDGGSQRKFEACADRIIDDGIAREVVKQANR
ncbi:ead/Ea22-like family protein [Chromobacterium haemolyticum]|uniref:ead/Ea22-like family protein n=1 Tax=Chromobacterium TaxID=535 RepID=UPI004056721E